MESRDDAGQTRVQSCIRFSFNRAGAISSALQTFVSSIAYTLNVVLVSVGLQCQPHSGVISDLFPWWLCPPLVPILVIACFHFSQNTTNTTAEGYWRLLNSPGFCTPACRVCIRHRRLSQRFCMGIAYCMSRCKHRHLDVHDQ